MVNPIKQIDERELIRLYQAGHTDEYIGRMVGLSRSGVIYRARKLDLRKPDMPPPRYKIVDVNRIIQLYVGERKSCDSIARELGVSSTLVKDRLKQCGIKLRKFVEYWRLDGR
jgi:biotin operon repressor